MELDIFPFLVMWSNPWYSLLDWHIPTPETAIISETYPIIGTASTIIIATERPPKLAKLDYIQPPEFSYRLSTRFPEAQIERMLWAELIKPESFTLARLYSYLSSTIKL